MKHAFLVDGRIRDRLPVYELLEDIRHESSISGKSGDIAIGGGSGEAKALCFAIPEIFRFLTDGPELATVETKPITCHWSMNEAFIFGTGFESLGWSPEEQALDIWLAEHLIAFLVRAYPKRYQHLVGEFPSELSGSIFTYAIGA